MPKQRYYDQEPTLSAAVDSLLAFPLSVQEIIALGLSQIATRECNAHELMRDVKSLGKDNVLALFKSKRRRRAYDHNPIVHQAFDHLFVLSPEHRIFVANQTIELANAMEKLLKREWPDYLNQEIPQATLTSLNQLMQLTVQKEAEKLFTGENPSSEKPEALRGNEDGMRLYQIDSFPADVKNHEQP